MSKYAVTVGADDDVFRSYLVEAPDDHEAARIAIEEAQAILDVNDVILVPYPNLMNELDFDAVLE